uniref:Uncharacterized protein n=1 Tax=Arion vulgaris TaxID=1028688 RepID=A0A0B7AY41_9EUPU
MVLWKNALVNIMAWSEFKLTTFGTYGILIYSKQTEEKRKTKVKIDTKYDR